MGRQAKKYPGTFQGKSGLWGFQTRYPAAHPLVMEGKQTTNTIRIKAAYESSKEASQAKAEWEEERKKEAKQAVAYAGRQPHIKIE